MERLSAALSGRYRIERELGAGGMATVYLAEDEKHHRKVAIKVLREDLAASLGAARFLREIEIAAALQHPNILPLLDSGEVRTQGDGGREDGGSLLYFVMPYVAGHSLRERLAREGELPIAEAVRLLTEVVDALAHAHDSGVVHRDVKPDNVMLSGRHALVTDFGVAKAVSEATGRQTLTTLGVALGTPTYMSPEQCSADPHIDHRSDIYSVGVLAYELFAGRPPFTGTVPQKVLAAHTMETPEPVSKHRQGLSPALEAVVMRCLAKRPADRWQSAQELLTQLEPFATPSGGTTPTLTRPVAAMGAKRTPLMLAGALLAAAIVVATAMLARRAPAAVTLGAATQVTAEAGLEVFPAISPDGKTVAYSAGSSTHMRMFIRSVGGTRAIPLTDDSTAIQANPRWSPDGERVLFLSGGGVFVAPKLGGPRQVLIPATAGAPIASACWSPDGREVAFVRGDSLLVTALNGAAQRLVAVRPSLQWCNWSPKGELIACVYGSTGFLTPGGTFGNLAPSSIVVVPARGGQFVAVTDSVSLNQSPAWSPGGDALFFVSSRQGARDVFMRRISSSGGPDGDAVRLTVGLNAQTISLSANGSRLAYSAYTQQANIAAIPIPSGAPVSASAAVSLTSGSQVVEGVRASRDGKWLVYDSNLRGNSDIYRLPLGGGPPERLTSDTADEFVADLSPNGKEIAFHSFHSGSRDVFVQTVEGGPLQQVTFTPKQESFPRWSPDGSAIAFLEQREAMGYIVRRRPDGTWQAPVMRVAEIAGGGGLVLSWSPDGRFLAGSRNGALIMVPTDSGDARIVYAPRPSSGDPIVRAPDWSPDGRTIYFKSFDARGRTSFWSIPSSGGRPRLLVFFDDPAKQSLRNDWSTDGKRFYFAVNDRQSDIWVVELNRP